MGVDGFECRIVSFDTVRHHRRGSAVRTAGARLAEEVTAINSNSVKYDKSEGKLRLAFFVCLRCGLAHKEQNKQKNTLLNRVACLLISGSLRIRTADPLLVRQML